MWCEIQTRRLPADCRGTFVRDFTAAEENKEGEENEDLVSQVISCTCMTL